MLVVVVVVADPAFGQRNLKTRERLVTFFFVNSRACYCRRTCGSRRGETRAGDQNIAPVDALAWARLARTITSSGADPILR